MKRLNIILIFIFFSLGLILPSSADAATRKIRKSPRKAAIIRPVEIKKIQPKIIPASTSVRVINQPVPFISQAPIGNWRDPRFADACEEASILMAMGWLNGQGISKQFAVEEIKKITAWEVEQFGFHQDTSIADTAKIMKNYYGLPIVSTKNNIGVADILDSLEKRKLVLASIDGMKFYRPGGPARHMIVVTGFDYEKEEFIVNDPYFANGGGLRVQAQVLSESLRDYPSGVHKPVKSSQASMLTVDWPWVL